MDAEAEREFREFVAARSAALFRSAYLLTGHREAAEDLLQTVLAKVARRPGEGGPGRGALRPAGGGAHRGRPGPSAPTRRLEVVA